MTRARTSRFEANHFNHLSVASSWHTKPGTVPFAWMLTLRAVFRSDLVEIADVGCRPVRFDRGADEYSPATELVFTRAGTFVRHLGTRPIIADAAHVLFYNRGEEFGVSHPTSAGDQCTTLTFSISALRDALEQNRVSSVRGQAPVFPVVAAPLDPTSLLLLYRLREFAARNADVATVEACALELLCRVTQRISHTEPRTGLDTGRRRRQLVEAARIVLASEPGAPHSLTDLARLAGTSPFHLTRCFRAEVGLSLWQYLSRLRLALALHSLPHAGSLSRLAFDLGFSSHSHFTAAFRRFYGSPPATIRPVNRLPPSGTGALRA